MSTPDSGSTKAVTIPTGENFAAFNNLAVTREWIRGWDACRMHLETLMRSEQPDEPAADVVAAMLDYNQMLRSFAMIASRNGEQTRWEGLYEQIHALLEKHNETWKRYFPPMQPDDEGSIFHQCLVPIQPETKAAPAVEPAGTASFNVTRYKVVQDKGEYCLKGCPDGDLVDFSAYAALLNGCTTPTKEGK